MTNCVYLIILINFTKYLTRQTKMHVAKTSYFFKKQEIIIDFKVNLINQLIRSHLSENYVTRAYRRLYLTTNLYKTHTRELTS